ncbi:MAG: hypothetical protein M3Q68_04765, partial [Actinomycetota bacterium]|nr:hypothetical protein [Actinomycetota bacterium]
MKLRRRLGLVLVALVAIALSQVSPLARAASPSSGSLGAPGDRASWTGGPFLVSSTDPANLEEACS